MGYSYVFNPLSGSFDTVQDVSGLVPYTGATSDVELGNNHLNVQTTGPYAVNIASRSVNAAPDGPIVFDDTFTEATNTLLENHTPEVGLNWGDKFTTGSTDIYVIGGAGYAAAIANAANIGVVNLANTSDGYGDDYEVKIKLSGLTSSSNVVNLVARYTSYSNYYCLTISASSGNCALIRRVGGVNTTLGLTFGAFTATDEIALRVVGDRIAIIKNGILNRYFIDSSLPSGKAGLGLGNILQNTSYDVSTANRIDRFTITQYTDVDPGMTALYVDGTIDASVQFLGQANDTVWVPSFSWTSDTTTGIYRPAVNQIGFAIAGLARATISSSGVFTNYGIYTGNGTASAPSHTFAGDTNTGFYRYTTDTIGITTAGSVKWLINSVGRLAQPAASYIDGTESIVTNGPVTNSGGSSGGFKVFNTYDYTTTRFQSSDDGSYAGALIADCALKFVTGYDSLLYGADSNCDFIINPNNSGSQIGNFTVSFGVVTEHIGGGIYLTAGACSSGAHGGPVYIAGGESYGDVGGSVQLFGGSGQYGGGGITLKGGFSANDQGGSIDISGGDSEGGSNYGGTVSIRGGADSGFITGAVLIQEAGGPFGVFSSSGATQADTSITGASFTGGGGTGLTDTDTFDGYTIAQVVAALRSYGWLA